MPCWLPISEPETLPYDASPDALRCFIDSPEKFVLLEPWPTGRWVPVMKGEDRRLWWQKVVDAIADSLAFIVRAMMEAWKWSRVGRRRWWDSDDL